MLRMLFNILKAAQLAPTAVNYQPQMIYVLKSDEALHKINRVWRCICGAPLVILSCSDERRIWKILPFRHRAPER